MHLFVYTSKLQCLAISSYIQSHSEDNHNKAAGYTLHDQFTAAHCCVLHMTLHEFYNDTRTHWQKSVRMGHRFSLHYVILQLHLTDCGN